MAGFDSDSDGEPEVISFCRGKKNFQDEYEQQKKAVDHEKNVLKEKRKKKHKLLVDQKESKLQRLDSQRLPNDILQELDAVAPDLSLSRKKEPKLANVDEISEQDDKPRLMLKKPDKEKKVRRTKTTQFLITTVDKDKELTNRYQEKGNKFLRGCLFGKRTPRVTSKTMLMNRKKQVIGGHRGPSHKLK